MALADPTAAPGRRLCEQNPRCRLPQATRNSSLIMHMTKVSDSVKFPAVPTAHAEGAGAPDDEMTPAMVDAGVSVLLGSGLVSASLQRWEAAELVSDIWRAIRLGRPS